jgi:DNA-binding transcriptional MerR regulator
VNSSELARATNTTVRALRHYHTLGILPEPPRGENGYRQYGYRELIRVLQIKRLSQLGITLKNMAPLLEALGAGTTDLSLLEALDKELELQIEQIERQRTLLAHLRKYEVSLDTPPELASYFSKQSRLGVSETLKQADREFSLVLAQFIDEQHMPELTALFEGIAAQEIAEESDALYQELEGMDVDCPDEAIDAYVERFIAILGDSMLQLQANSTLDLTDTPIEDVLQGYLDAQYNPAQRKALERIMAYFEIADTGEDQGRDPAQAV